MYDANLFTDYEQRLFTRVVALAERHGKPVNLLVVPSTNVFDAVAQTALRLDSAEIITGLSAKMSAATSFRADWARRGSGCLKSLAARLNTPL
ncbi:MAG TPA: hypothetical protein VNN73_20545 [Blastocatellia bacterium]|nr:hypothetical protein [Blastocatellia bacterium]